MNDPQFDALARGLSTRRTALGRLLAVLATGLKLSAPKAAAHNRVPACKQRKDPQKRRACLRRARAHSRQHQRCRPRRPAEFCGGRCGGAAINNCGQPVRCPTCPSGKICLSNGSCSRICAVPGIPGDCPAGCGCGVPAVEGGTHCIPAAVACPDMPQTCTTSSQCQVGSFCGGGVVAERCGTNRCVPVCPL